MHEGESCMLQGQQVSVACWGIGTWRVVSQEIRSSLCNCSSDAEGSHNTEYSQWVLVMIIENSNTEHQTIISRLFSTHEWPIAQEFHFRKMEM